jgi:hypothetical protein
LWDELLQQSPFHEVLMVFPSVSHPPVTVALLEMPELRILTIGFIPTGISDHVVSL